MTAGWPTIGLMAVALAAAAGMMALRPETGAQQPSFSVAARVFAPLVAGDSASGERAALEAAEAKWAAASIRDYRMRRRVVVFGPMEEYTSVVRGGVAVSSEGVCR